MKTSLSKVALIILLTLLYCVTRAQSGNNEPRTITYDTTGTGTGNDTYTFSLRKFDPSLGTLTSVTIASDVLVNYTYSIGNTRSSSALYRTRILRTDDISSTALDPSSISIATQTPNLNTTVAANTTLQVGPLTMTYVVSNIINDGHVINFMGSGTLDYSYSNSSFVAFSGPSGSNVDFTKLNDTLHFSVKYTFSPSSALTLNLTSFTAVKKDNNTVQLGWQQLNEEKNRIYTVQISTDGKEFKNITDIASNSMGVYNYAYTYTSAYNKKMFFRIMQTDNTPTSYSVVRVVDGSDKNISGMHIFPSLLTDKMAIQFNKQDNRKITLYSMTGKPVWSNTYMNTATIRIALPPDLKKGIYIVEAVNIKNSEREVSRIVIQ